MRVTASFGSFPPAAPGAFRVLRLGFFILAFLTLRFGIMAGILT
jgi:hypothetical protein